MIWRLRHRNTINRRLGIEQKRDDATGWFLLGLGAILGTGIAIGILAERINTAADAPMTCHEDEALVWVDAPTTAGCVPLDALR